MSMETFQEQIRLKKSPVVACLNPDFSVIPPQLKEVGFACYGRSLKGAAEAARLYCTGLIEGLHDLIPAVQIGLSAFHCYGSAGIAAMEDIIRCARAHSLFVIMDARCADDGARAEAAANAWLGGLRLEDGTLLCPYDCDAVTVSGYGGTDSIHPYTALCRTAGQPDKAVFLVARTPNASTREVQDLITGTRMVHTAVADLAVRLTDREQLLEECGWSSLGLVAGMNRAGELAALRRKYPKLFLLVPEYGINGCRTADIRAAMDPFGHGVAVCVSHQLLSAWHLPGDDPEGARYVTAARGAADKIRRDLTRGISIL